MSNDFVINGLDKDTFMSVMSRVASQERTVVEFRTTERPDGERVLEHIVEITDHVDTLEDDINE
jgi:hypothetical protein